MQISEKQLELLNTLVSSFQTDYDLSNLHLFKKRAGLATLFFDTKDFLQDKNFVISELVSMFNLPIKIYGGVSNTLITLEGFDGIFIIDRKVGTDNIKIHEKESEIVCDGAVLLSTLVRVVCEAGFDLGCLASIPGTVGGGVIGNCGAGNTGKYISDFITKIEAYNILERKIEIFYPDEKFFSGRKSLLQDFNIPCTKYIIDKVTLKPNFVGSEKAVEYLKERIEYRKKVNEEGHNFGTAGSFWANRVLPDSFKINNPDVKVRDLIVRTGLDKLNINGARYTPNYSFLSTEDNTSDEDVAQLLKITVNALQRDYNITPYKEVEILSKNGVITLDEYFALYQND
ncbi:MAG: FAD-binding protein [Candidatus Magasanikiibacteriota bacterium]